MHAALVRSFDRPPRYETFETPVAHGEHELLVDVLAADLHPRVRSDANGSHYASTGELPLIPGFDGVGRTPGGDLVYFVLTNTAFGSMAERTVVDRRGRPHRRCHPGRARSGGGDLGGPGGAREARRAHAMTPTRAESTSSQSTSTPSPGPVGAWR